MEKYNFNTYLVRTDGLTYVMLIDDERFKEIYTDNDATIFVKTIAQ